MLFPFAVRDRARLWLESQPKDSLNSWDKLVTAFLAKYFPPQKLSKLRADVQTFRQKEGKSLYEAWERYKQLTKKCPSDMLSEWTILDIFYDGLSELSKMSLDTSAGGSIHLKKTPAEAQELIDMVANNQFMYTSERNPVNNGTPMKKGVLEVDTLNAILAQNKILTQQVNMISQSLHGMQAASNSTQEASSEEEAYDPENPAIAEVNYLGEPYGNTYNSTWRNHPNFSWKDQKPQQGFNNGGRNRFSNSKPFPSSTQQQTENSEQNASNLANLVSDLSEATVSFMNEIRSSIRNLEAQVSQLSKRITEIPPSTLPSNTEENPKGECKAIDISAMAEPVRKGEDVNPKEEDLLGRPVINKELPSGEPKDSEAHLETIEIPLNLLMPFMSSDEYSSSEENEDVTEEQTAKFLGAIMKLNAKLFGTDAWEVEPPLFINELSDLDQVTLPQKRQDPGKFIIPCTIGTRIFKALCDLGSGINLMPLSVIEKLGIYGVQATKISLEMADSSRKQAYGQVEDVLVKVEGLYIPTDFIVLDTGKEEGESIILGRPFLATARAVIDVDRGEIVLQWNENSLVFKTQGSPSATMERKLEKLLSKQSQPEPPQSNSKFGVGRPQPNSKFGVELPYPNSKFGVGESQQSSAHL
ncbi:hypothetical protein AHAS_Ahas16G0204600 [Arachis hypogaea]